MKITYWKGTYVADHQPGDERTLKKVGFQLHEPTLCDRSTCRACRAGIGRRYFSPRVEDATRLRSCCTERALAAMHSHLQRLAQSRALDANITVPAPPDLAYDPYQRAGIAYALQRKDTLLGDEMGLGKTVEALGFVNYTRPRTVLVVAPATLVLNWRSEIERWVVGRYPVMIPRTASDVIPDASPLIVVTNYEKLVGHAPRRKQIPLAQICPSPATQSELASASPEKLASLADSTDADPACVPVVIPLEVDPDVYQPAYGESRIEAARLLGRARVTALVLPAGTPRDPRSIDLAKKTQLDTPLSRSLRRPWDVAIYDEAQALKTPESQRSRAVLGKDGYYHLARRVLFLSGTPMENYPREIWPIAATVCPAKFGNRKEFEHRYCGLHVEERGSRRVWVADGATRTSELQQRLRSTFMIRRLKKDVLPELPPKRRQLVILDEEIDWSAHPELVEWKRIYEDASAEALARLEAARTVDEYRRAVRALETVSIPFEKTSQCRHETGLLKLPACLRYTDQMLDGGVESMVIFAHHRDILDKIHEHYGSDACLIYGDTDKDDRFPLVQAFQEGRYKIFCAGLRAAGVGLTLTRSSTVIFFETDWNPATIVQAEDRTHRRGQKQMVHSLFPTLDGSLDANMLKKILKKQDMIDKILNQPEQLQLPATRSTPSR